MKKKKLKFFIVLAIIMTLIIYKAVDIKSSIISENANIKTTNSENIEVANERIYR